MILIAARQAVELELDKEEIIIHEEVQSHTLTPLLHRHHLGVQEENYLQTPPLTYC